MALAWLGEKYPTVRVAAACNLGHSPVRVAAASVVAVVVVAAVASVVDVAWLTLGWLPSCLTHIALAPLLCRHPAKVTSSKVAQ